jgi:Mg-chelatase subunit ChlD
VTNSSYTHITVVVDRSGSMDSIRDDAEGGLRTFLADQRAQDGTLTTSVVQFDDEYDEVARMATADPLRHWHLEPRGMTALLDALGRAITSTGEDLARLPEHERPGRVFVVVVTDGQENSSREWTREQVFNAIRRQSKQYGWTFVYTAAGQDAVAVGRSMGIDHSASFAATPDGVSGNYSSLSTSLSAARSGRGFRLENPS